MGITDGAHRHRARGRPPTRAASVHAWSGACATGQTGPAPPGDVLSADRTPDQRGPRHAAAAGAPPLDSPGCSFGCVDVATGRDGTAARRLAAEWRERRPDRRCVARRRRRLGRPGDGAVARLRATAHRYAAITAVGRPRGRVELHANNSADATRLAPRRRRGSGSTGAISADSHDRRRVASTTSTADGHGDALTAFRASTAACSSRASTARGRASARSRCPPAGA